MRVGGCVLWEWECSGGKSRDEATDGIEEKREGIEDRSAALTICKALRDCILEESFGG